MLLQCVDELDYTKPATKACVRNIFGKETKVKAKPAKTVVKAYPVAALKKQI